MSAKGGVYEPTCVEVVLAKLFFQAHKVTLDEGNLALETGLLRVLARTSDLESIFRTHAQYT